MIVFKKDISGNDIPIIIDNIILESPDWSFTGNDMGDNRITLNIKLPYNINPNFQYDWFVRFENEIYFLINKKPNSIKDTTTRSIKYTLIFGGIEEKLKKRLFLEIFRYSDTSQLSYSTNVNFVGTIKDLAYRLQLNFDANFGIDKFIVDLNPIISNSEIPYEQWKTISYSDATLWDVVINIYEIFNVRWYLTTINDIDYLKIGYPTEELEHIFEYGGGVSDIYSKGGLTSLTVSNSNENIKTRLRGIGGTENIPINYFGLFDSTFLTDGEYTERRGWYRNLFPKSFRMYVMGHNDRRLLNRFIISDNIEDITINTFLEWNNYYKNYGSSKFITINFDDDCIQDHTLINTDWLDLSTRPFAFKQYIKGWIDQSKGDFYPITWADSENIKEYGIIDGILSENDKIKPSIIGVTRANIGRIDELIDAEIIVRDVIVPFVPQQFPSHTEELYFNGNSASYTYTKLLQVSGAVPIDKDNVFFNFSIIHNMAGSAGVSTIEIEKLTISNAGGTPIEIWANDFYLGGYGEVIGEYGTIENGKYTFRSNYIENGIIEDAANFNHKFSESNAKYRLKFNTVRTVYRETYMKDGFVNNVSHILSKVKAKSYYRSTIVGTLKEIPEKQSFFIYTKDIGFDLYDNKYWGTEDAEISFNTGDLAGEYGFTIIKRNGIPQVFLDESKFKICNVNGVDTLVQSKYRIELKKSDEDYEATGLLLPNSFRNAKGGDFFYIHKIELPFEYVYYAEERYDVFIRNELSKIDHDIPKITFELDNMFIENVIEKGNDRGKLKAGNNIRIMNQPSFGDGYITTTINTITKSPNITKAN